MKIVRYTGRSTVRTIGAGEIEAAYGIATKGLEIDTRVSRTALVSNALAAKLVETGEFDIASDADEEDEDREHAAREAANKAAEEMDAERREQMDAQMKATIESGEPPRLVDPSTAPESVVSTKAAPSRPPRTTTT